MKKLEFKYGYYFSPGFYRDYWINYIQGKIPGYDSFSNNRLEPYQELWLGSIFAALYTKSTGDKYYVGPPESDPPDVWLVRHVPIVYKEREATSLERMSVEITRCNLDEGENLFDQIMNKNTPAYDNMVLLVYLYGVGQDVNFSEICEQLAKKDKVHPMEIFVIANITGKDGIKPRSTTFVGAMVYPEYRTQMVSMADDQAFFHHPSAITQGKLGLSRELKPVETRVIMPPSLD